MPSERKCMRQKTMVHHILNCGNETFVCLLARVNGCISYSNASNLSPSGRERRDSLIEFEHDRPTFRDNEKNG